LEEIGLCWRLKNKGYRIVYSPKSMVYHVGGGTLSYDNPQKLFLNFRNNLWLLYKNLPDNRLFGTLLIRMVLDGIAAMKLLFEFNLNGIRSVLKAHYHFYKSLPMLRLKRKALLTNSNTYCISEIFHKSIVFQYYIRKNKRFDLLMQRNKP